MTPLLLLVTILAAYRISRFLTHDIIPFQSLRDWLEERWKGTVYEEGFTCPWCMGAWVSFALVAGLAQIVSVPLPGLYALAVSTGVGIIGYWTED